MTLAEAMVFALESAVEALLVDLCGEDHRDRLTYVEAARLIEEMAGPWMEQAFKQQQEAS